MKIYAHRGSWDTSAEKIYLLHFWMLQNFQYRGIEFDVRMAKDGELVVIHDVKIDRDFKRNRVRQKT